jgi:PAS domain-containing protein
MERSEGGWEMVEGGVVRDPQLAAWLVGRRRVLEHALTARLGERWPAPGAPEAEALRRFRTFAAAALQRGDGTPPSLDGLRVQERAVATLIEAWCEVAAEQAGPRAAAVQASLSPLARRFRAALRDQAPARRRSGAPRTGRRAVVAAIDRVADAYLAIDVDARRIVDANPAAGSLLATTRDALLGADAETFLPAGERDGWWAELDALAEGGDTRRFPARVSDAHGGELAVETSLTRYARRGQVLALALLRPRGGAPRA